MFTKAILAVSGALLTAVAAVPMAEPHHRHHPQHKRDLIWVTEIEEVTEIIPVTKTVWVEPGETVPAAYYSSEDIQPAAYTPASSPSTPAARVTPSSSAESVPQSIYVAPAPSSTYVAPPVYSAPTTSSVYVAPTPTTSVYVAPTPTSTYVVPYVAPTTSSAAAAAPVYGASDSSADYGSGSAGLSGIAAPGKGYSGDLTYYAVGMGSCGFPSTEGEYVVAVSHEIMSVYNGGNPNTNPLCGTTLTITGTNGEKFPAKIVDTCPGCTIGSLDLPEAYFNKITGNADGRIGGIEWSFD